MRETTTPLDRESGVVLFEAFLSVDRLRSQTRFLPLIGTGLGAHALLTEQSHDLPVEGGQIVRLPAAHPVAIANRFLVLPVAAGVADVVLQRRPARDRSSLHESGRNEQPRTV